MKALVFVLFALVSVGASAAEPYQGDQAPVALKGDYWVPVEDALKPFGLYPLDDICWFGDGASFGLGYRLPPELTGHDDSMIQLSGVDAGLPSFKLTSSHGDADCVRNAGMVSCQIKYRGLKTDMARAKQLLTSEVADAAELGLRLTVTERFQADPIGVISFPDRIQPFPNDGIWRH